MHVGKGAGDRIDLTMSDDERYLVKQCLTECCFGIRIPNFSSKIGADKRVVSHLLDQLDAGKEISIPGPNDLGMARIGDNQFSVALTMEQARIFTNCMNETEKALGPSEFPSRFGANLDEVKALFSAIAAVAR